MSKVTSYLLTLFIGWLLFCSIGPVTLVKAQEITVEKMPEVVDGSFYIDQQGIRYKLKNNGTCNIDGYIETIKPLVTIPENIQTADGTYTVKGISSRAFEKCTVLKEIEIPNSVTKINGDVFQGCKKLSAIQIVPVDSSVKISGEKASCIVKINEALFSTAANVKLTVGEDVVKKAAVDKTTATVTLLIYTVNNPKYSIKNTQPAQILLQKEAVRAIAKSGKQLKAVVKNAQGSCYHVKVPVKEMKYAEKNISFAITEQAANSIDGQLRSDLKKLLSKNGLNEKKIKLIDVSYEKASPKNIRTNIEVIFQPEGISGVHPGSSIYLYRYQKTKHTFTAVSYHPYTVSKQSNVKIPVSKGGIYVAAKKQLQDMASQLSNEFLTEDGNTYYIDKNGTPVCGWKKIGSEYYYFDRDNGKMAYSCKVDGVKVLADGTAKQTEAAKAKILAMIKARNIVNAVTKPSDSKSEKIEKCFRWIFQFPYKRYRLLKPIYKKPGWEVTFANDIFDKQKGCCVSEASALAFLFHECGYKTVYVACDTGHAWVELNGRVYDPLFAEARGYDKYYNRSYDGYGMYPVLKRKI